VSTLCGTTSAVMTEVAVGKSAYRQSAAASARRRRRSQDTRLICSWSDCKSRGRPGTFRPSARQQTLAALLSRIRLGSSGVHLTSTVVVGMLTARLRVAGSPAGQAYLSVWGITRQQIGHIRCRDDYRQIPDSVTRCRNETHFAGLCDRITAGKWSDWFGQHIDERWVEGPPTIAAAPTVHHHRA